MTAWGLCYCTGVSLVVASRGYFPVSTHRLLIAMPSLIAGHRLYLCWLPWLQHVGSVAVALGSRSQAQQLWQHGLSGSRTCGIVLNQGLNLHLLHWQADSMSLEPSGKPQSPVIKTALYKYICLNCDKITYLKQLSAYISTYSRTIQEYYYTIHGSISQEIIVKHLCVLHLSMWMCELPFIVENPKLRYKLENIYTYYLTVHVDSISLDQ